jgi:hypothetical protein
MTASGAGDRLFVEASMRRRSLMLRKSLVTACAMVSFAMLGGAMNVYAADVTLYEVTENMKLKQSRR